MRRGDLVQVYRNPESNPIEESKLIMGILLDYDEEERGWDILVGDQIECYPYTWWSVMEVTNETR
jgi:hypothetical protein